jgi:methylenetetrahydrofolate dehydrogenase (NADP+)/methenyltetrahydrofolate cyclohydrolase
MSEQRANVLDGKAIAQKVRSEVRDEVSALTRQGIQPGLAVIIVGDDPASQVYVRNKGRACHEVGISVFDHHLPAQTTASELSELIHQLNHDSRVHGVLLQLPIPVGLPVGEILDQIDPMKDVDGLLAENVGRLWLGRPRFVPCTPLGVMRILAEAGTTLSGARAVVIGRSILVGASDGGLAARGGCDRDDLSLQESRCRGASCRSRRCHRSHRQNQRPSPVAGSSRGPP